MDGRGTKRRTPDHQCLTNISQQHHKSRATRAHNGRKEGQPPHIDWAKPHTTTTDYHTGCAAYTRLPLELLQLTRQPAVQRTQHRTSWPGRRARHPAIHFSVAIPSQNCPCDTDTGGSVPILSPQTGRCSLPLLLSCVRRRHACPARGPRLFWPFQDTRWRWPQPQSLTDGTEVCSASINSEIPCNNTTGVKNPHVPISEVVQPQPNDRRCSQRGDRERGCASLTPQPSVNPTPAPAMKQ